MQIHFNLNFNEQRLLSCKSKNGICNVIKPASHHIDKLKTFMLFNSVSQQYAL